MLLTLLVWLITLLLILLSVAFFTLFERNFIGLIHLRVGPNNVSLIGLLQPILDAVNLLSNQPLMSLRVNPVSFHLSPHVALLIPLITWLVLPYPSFSNSYTILVFVILGSILVFSVLLGGWASNSNYSLFGSLRSVAQSISYEAVFTTLVILIMSSLSTYSIISINIIGSIIILYILPIYIFTSLAELHRAPFDFSEAESELVSGFNTEYSGTYFAYLFLSEYSILILSSIVLSMIFSGFTGISSYYFFTLVSLGFLTLFTWIRVTFCRYRYDKLIISAWNSYLPVTLFLLCIYLLYSI